MYIKYSRQFRSFFFVLALCFVLCAQALANETSLTWDAPSSVSQGRGFIITLKGENPFSGTLLWRKHTIPFVAEANASAYEAKVLLGVPHNADNNMKLVLNAQEEVGTKQIKIEKSAIIEPLAVKWVTHNLTVEPKYVQPPKDVLDRIERERQKRAPLFDNFNASPTWELPFYRPVKGTISGSFGARRVFNNVPKSPHLGTDLRGPVGTPIYSLADGVVVLAEDHYYSGNAVYIDHGQGVLSMYGHLSEFAVKAGDSVKKGELIGKVGMTGRVTGPHLHLSLYIQGVSVDVMPFMEKALVNGNLVVVGGPTPEQPRPQTNSK